MADTWEVAATVGSRFTAQVVAARLADVGIDSQVYADDFSGQLPFPLHGQPAMVKVRSQDLDEAKAVLAEVYDDDEEYPGVDQG